MRKPFEGNYQLTQGFGENPQVYAQFGMAGHNGQDYGLQTGTLIVAPHDGKILEARIGSEGYGNYIKVESAIEGSVLAHLRDFLVAVGQDVKEGEPLGYSDNTGFSTGAHLHWGYYRIPRDRTNGYDGYIDQAPYLLIQPQPPVIPENISRKSRYFDLLWHAWYGMVIDTDSVTDTQLQARIAESLSEKKRSGMWDTIGKRAGLTGDSSNWTVDQAYATIQKISNELLSEQLGSCQKKLQDIKTKLLALSNII